MVESFERIMRLRWTSVEFGGCRGFWVSFASFMTYGMVDVILAIGTSYTNDAVLKDPKDDYYDYLDNKSAGAWSYHGEYMKQ